MTPVLPTISTPKAVETLVETATEPSEFANLFAAESFASSVLQSNVKSKLPIENNDDDDVGQTTSTEETTKEATDLSEATDALQTTKDNVDQKIINENLQIPLPNETPDSFEMELLTYAHQKHEIVEINNKTPLSNYVNAKGSLATTDMVLKITPQMTKLPNTTAKEVHLPSDQKTDSHEKSTFALVETSKLQTLPRANSITNPALVQFQQIMQRETNTDATVSFGKEIVLDNTSLFFTDRQIVRTDHNISTPLRTTPLNIAHNIATQLSVAVSTQHTGITEIALNPEELGRVRLSLTATDATLTLNIIADRPETSDLMRRHIDILGQEFEKLGYSDVSFSFDKQDEQKQQDNHPRNPDQQNSDKGTIPTHTYHIADDSLDIRL